MQPIFEAKDSSLLLPYEKRCEINEQLNPYQSNQTFHYTRCIAPKRVTSLRGPSLRQCARAAQLLSKKCQFELQTSRSKDERATAQPRGRKD